jgi:glycosyltransferase involved in cell wall biosynthesis
MRILFFTESLVCGGKERRLLELIQYLKANGNHTIALVITESSVHYDYAYGIGIPIKVIKRKVKYDPLPFFRFYKYCHSFKPDIIHAWGRMTTFYAIPAKYFQRIPMITSMIANAQRVYKTISIRNLFFNVDIFFSDMIISNSQAGLIAYRVNTPKARVIKNGVRLERFRQNFDIERVRDEIGVKTDLMLVMVASFSDFKDYDLFINVAKEVGKKKHDVTFVGVGGGPEWERINKRISDEKIHNVILTGNQKEVEPIIAASDIGILCTYTEGISNTLMEYMALGKPSISTDIVGGSKELIFEGETGYCVERDVQKIVYLIVFLLDNPYFRITMGEKARHRINEHFSINRMGEEYEASYIYVLEKRK